MRNLRRVSQLACLAIFLFLLTRTSYPLNQAYPVDIFPRLSPLLAITTSLASRAAVTVFWPALVVVAATLILGRAFCGWVCPMGTTLDICDRLLKRKRNPVEDKKPAHRRWKFGLLAVLLAGSILGLQLAGWFDPMSLATRSYALALIPYTNFLAASVLDLLLLAPGVEPIFYPVEQFLRERVLSFEQPVFSSHILFALIFAGIVALGSLNRRFWCRSLCPMGGMLALIGRYPALKRKVSDDCTRCLKCQRACMTDAIVGEGSLLHVRGRLPGRRRELFVQEAGGAAKRGGRSAEPARVCRLFARGRGRASAPEARLSEKIIVSLDHKAAGSR